MDDKQHLLATLRSELDRWEELLLKLTEGQIVARPNPGELSIKDVIAHLMAWQQISIARLQAAVEHAEPRFQDWPPEFEPDADEDLERINAWIFETYRDQPWLNVHRAWREGFLRVLDLGAAIPEHDLLNSQRFPWLGGYSLSAVLEGTYGHHHSEHLPALLATVERQGKQS